MPLGWLQEYARMMPKLIAEESLRGVMVHAAGAGVMEKSEQRKVLGEWRRVAGSGETKQRLPKHLHKAMLESMGIRVCQKS